MSEFSELYGDNFFIIDSNNFKVVDSRLYGFSILNNNIVKEDNYDSNTLLSGLGAYIHIKSDDEKISIYQDFNGSWGLYLYKYEDYFAISNSFLYLVEYLKNNHPISLNEDYSNALMFIEKVPLTFKQTLINEIERIPRNYSIHIDKAYGKILFKKMDYNIHFVSLDSRDALDILDDWFYRWIAVLGSIKSDTNNIEFDLNDSWDSKIILMFALFSDINLNQIFFKMNNPNNLINEFINEYSLKLNHNDFLGKKIYFHDLDTILNITFYVNFGFNNQVNYNFFRTSEPIYMFSGSATEMIGINNNSEENSFNETLDYYRMNSKYYVENFESSFGNLLFSSLNELRREYHISNENSNDLFDLIYWESLLSNHFGKLIVSEFLTNKFIISPFLDPNLHKIRLSTNECNDQNLLYAVILTRYFSKFLKFINVDFKISDSTINHAFEINKIKPFVLKDFDHISCPNLSINNYNDDGGYSLQDIHNYLINAFKSLGFKTEFNSHFSNKLYFNLLNRIENNEECDLKHIYPSFYVLKIINDVNNEGYKFSEWLSNLIERNHFHGVPEIIGLNEKLNSKSSINHTHEFLTRNQVKNLQMIIGNKRIFKKVSFNVYNSIIDENEPIKLFNLNILDFDNKSIVIDFKELYVIFDNQFSILFEDISFIEFNSNREYYNISTVGLAPGEYEICLRYKDTYSEDIKVIVKNKNNLFNVGTWLSLDISNFEKFQVESISCSTDWADINNTSIKVICDGKNNYQAVVTPIQQVCPNDMISAYVTIFNSEEEVIVRLFESSLPDYTDIVVFPSEYPKRINISRFASTNNMQLLLISRVKQVFYADNFVFTIIK